MMAFQASRGTPRNSSGWTSVCSSSSEDARRATCSITGLRNARISLWPPSIRTHLNMQIHATYRYTSTCTYIPMDILILAGIFLLPVLYTSTSTWRVGAWALFCVSPDRSLSPGTVTITAGEPLGSTRWDLPTRKTWWLVEPWKYTVDRYRVSVKNGYDNWWFGSRYR